jgi:type IV pilus assembly protein PilB
MKIENLHLYDYLLEHDLVSGYKLDEFFVKAQNENLQLSSLLVKEKIFGEDQMLHIMAEVLGFPFIDLEEIKLDIKILNLITRQEARQFKVIPLAVRDEKTLQIAMSDPENFQLIQQLEKKTKLKIEPWVATPETIKKAWQQYTPQLKADEIIVIEEMKKSSPINKDDFTMRIVDAIISHSILDEASEIQIKKEDKQTVIFYRLEGILVQKMSLPVNIFQDIAEIIKIIANLSLQQNSLSQNGSFVIEKNRVKTYFQVSVVPRLQSEEIILTLDDNPIDNLSLTKIGLAQKEVEIIQKVIRRDEGLILLSGPMGAGKTTTLYALLGLLNSTNKNIATIENPVERNLNKINQHQVDLSKGITFESGLLSILNQDVDIIGVGEILGKKVLDRALLATITDRLILASMYAQSTINVIQNIFELKIDPILAARSIKIIITQKLVKKLCSNCREQYYLSQEDLKRLAKKYNLERWQKTIAQRNDLKEEIDLTEIPFYRSVGCKSCGSTGYIGEIAVFEVLLPSIQVQKLIAKKARIEKIQEAVLQQKNFYTFIEDGVDKITQGLTDLQEIESLIQEKIV